jgi:hypothetical protein
MAKQQPIGKTPTVGLQPPVQIHEHAPASTIKGAIAGAAAHVAAVNAASKGKGK